jgi:NAD(P)-dependent dehydrogenase (short-subunit alcohol dehydrogenase family)
VSSSSCTSKPLAEKVAIVTGAGRGLGRAVALRLARDGARQLLVDIDPATAENTADEVGGQGARARALTADVADDRGCERVVYAASKGAVRSLTKALAREWGVYNICVNTIWPSAVTPSWQNWRRYKPEQVANHLEEELALKRPGDPLTDVAPVVAFLCGPDSAWVTGQTVAANGGWTMW